MSGPLTSLYQSIKAEKRMSFNHWRYRLLHWCFNETATRPEDSDLPEFMYTHYCPLFHVTNFIAILLPVIIPFKIGVAIIKGSIAICELVPWQDIGNTLWIPIQWMIDQREQSKERATAANAEAVNERLKRTRVKEAKRQILNKLFSYDYKPGDFERFWGIWGSEYGGTLEKGETKEYFDTTLEKIIATKKRLEAKREKRKQLMIFWSQFSEVFFRWFFNICYLLLAIFVIWMLFVITPPVVQFVIWAVHLFFTFDTLAFLALVGIWTVKVILIVIPFFILIYGFLKFQVVRKGTALMGAAIAPAGPPIAMMIDCCIAPFRWMNTAWNSTVEFVEMFYKENCPPITIVSGDDEAIEEKLQDA